MKVAGLTCEWKLSPESRKKRGEIASRTNQDRDWERTRSRPPLDEARIALVRQLYEAGANYQEINRELNVQIPVIKLICRARPPAGRFTPRNEREYQYASLQAVQKAIASPPRRWRRKPSTDQLPR